jgi:hypothetical protein
VIRAVLALFLVASQAVAAAPTLTHIFPAGGRRGTKVTVTCSGAFDWKKVGVWSPGVKSTVLKEPGKLEIEIPKDLAADRTWIRLHTDEGASPVVPFLLGDLPETVETEPNNRPSETKPLAIPVVVNGALAKGEVDSFAVDLKKGQALVAALDANTRLGSPMDAVLQVVSPAGAVAAENHDHLGLDPRLAHVALADGIHMVRVFAFPSMPDSSISFAGSASYVYRLTLTTGPFATHAAPVAVSLGKPGAALPEGWNIPKGTTGAVSFPRIEGLVEHLPAEVPALAPGARMGRVTAPGVSGAMEAVALPVPLVPQAPDGATNMSAPAAVSGHLAAPRAKNIYKLDMKKGQRLLVTLNARSLGFPTDPVVRWIDPAGKVVTEADDMGSYPDPTLSVTASVDGIHTLQVADRFGHGSERHRYLLTVRPLVPEFDLSVAVDNLVLPAGKAGELAVKVTRKGQGPVGPIAIRVEGLPAGVKVSDVVSEAKGPTAAAVTLKFTGDGKAWSGPIRVLGKAKDLPDTAALVPARMGVALETVWLTEPGK